MVEKRKSGKLFVEVEEIENLMVRFEIYVFDKARIKDEFKAHQRERITMSKKNSSTVVASTSTVSTVKATKKSVKVAASSATSAPAPVETPVIAATVVASEKKPAAKKEVTRVETRVDYAALAQKQLAEKAAKERSSYATPESVLKRIPGLEAAVREFVLSMYVATGVLTESGERTATNDKAAEWRNLVLAQTLVRQAMNDMYSAKERQGTLTFPNTNIELTPQECGAVQKYVLGESENGRPLYNGQLHRMFEAVFIITQEHMSFAAKTRAAWEARQGKGQDHKGSPTLGESASLEEFKTYQRAQGQGVAKMGDVLGDLLKKAEETTENS